MKFSTVYKFAACTLFAAVAKAAPTNEFSLVISRYGTAIDQAIPSISDKDLLIINGTDTKHFVGFWTPENYIIAASTGDTIAYNYLNIDSAGNVAVSPTPRKWVVDAKDASVNFGGYLFPGQDMNLVAVKQNNYYVLRLQDETVQNNDNAIPFTFMIAYNNYTSPTNTSDVPVSSVASSSDSMAATGSSGPLVIAPASNITNDTLASVPTILPQVNGASSSVVSIIGALSYAILFSITL